jgi:predicted ATPase
MQGPVWMILRGPGSPDFGATQERARVMLEQLGDESAVVTFHTALHSWARGRLNEALERVDRLDALDSATTADDGPRLAQRTMRGLVYWHIAKNVEAERLLGDTVAIYDANRHLPIYAQYLMEFGVFGRFYLSLTKTVLGQVEEGAALALDAAQLADVLPFPHAKGFSQLANFVCAMLRGDVATCMRFANQALAYSSAQGFPEFVAMATFARGWAVTESGERKAGLLLMREGLQNWDRTGFICWQSIYSALLASALIADGQFGEAREVLDGAYALVGETGERQALAPLCLARAKLAAATGEAAVAKALAAEALAICDEQSAGLWRNQVLQAFPQATSRE